MPAIAKDLDAISRFVAPAYVAMNVTAVCARRDAAFLSLTSGARGNALHYAEHVKNEAIESLTQEEAVAALTAAADAARDAALHVFRQFNSNDPAIESERIKAWCEADGRNHVRDFIRDHDEHHQALLSQLRASQR